MRNARGNVPVVVALLLLRFYQAQPRSALGMTHWSLIREITLLDLPSPSLHPTSPSLFIPQCSEETGTHSNSSHNNSPPGCLDSRQHSSNRPRREALDSRPRVDLARRRRGGCLAEVDLVSREWV